MTKRVTKKTSGALPEKFIARFIDALTRRPALLPRVASKPRIKRVLCAVRDEGKGAGCREMAAEELLSHLQSAGLARLIDTEGRGRGVPEIFLLGTHSSTVLIDPVELLCAGDSERVVCYFSALAYYGLTTQSPPHHHAALLIDYGVRTKRVAQPRVSGGHRKVRDPLGRKLFDYQGTPYYLTWRDKRLVPGVQRREMGAAGVVYITTLEQTLIDALSRPLSCGGPAVVFEAWESGIAKINQGRLKKYLQAIDDGVRTRRVGWMLQRLGYNWDEGGGLGLLFKAALNGGEKSGSDRWLAPLLPGVIYEGIDEKWGLKIPLST